MNISTYLAWKYSFRNKKRSFFMMASICLVLTMTIAVAIVQANGLNRQIEDAKINYGNWHLGFYLENDTVINSVRNNEYTQKASLVKHLQPFPFGKEIFDITLLEYDCMDMFMEQLVKGQYPQNQYEIVVPDWYLRKYDIDKLPHTLQSSHINLIITGAYKAKASSISNNEIKVFMCIENNPYFSDATVLSPIPFTGGNIFINDENSPTSFLFVQLKERVNINEAVNTYIKISGVKLFPAKDIFTGKETSPLYNASLIIAEGRRGFNEHNVGRQSDLLSSNLSLIINAIMQAVLFIMIFVSMNLIINNNVRILGMFAAIGLTPAKIRNMVLWQTVFILLVSIPFACVLGIAGSYAFLSLSVGVVGGSVVLPVQTIIVCIAVCLCSVIMATLYPAIKASKISPITAINTIQGVNQDDNLRQPRILKLSLIRGKIAFSLLFGLKNIFKNKSRALSFLVIITLLLAVFIKLSSAIEKEWKSGDWRQSYKGDYEISALYRDSLGKRVFNPISYDVIASLSNLDGVDTVYYQYSIFDFGVDSLMNCYNYFFQFPFDLLTEQGQKQLELSAPLRREGYSDDAFIFAGLSGYTEKELAFAEEYLIDGNIDIQKMENEPIILLPKYILWLENADIPYSNLQVGDKITLIENQSTSMLALDIHATYTFTIGGFVDNLPLPQINGVSNGFVGIMHYKQLEKLQTAYKGVAGIYISRNGNANLEQPLSVLASNNGYKFINHVDSFEGRERANEMQAIIMALYSIFAVLALVIFLAIFNMLLSSIFMRKGEFALMSAMGMSNTQRTISILAETLVFVVPGVLLGCAVGIVFIIAGDLRSEILTASQMIPWTHIFVSASVILLATAVATGIGLGYANKNSSVEKIRQE